MTITKFNPKSKIKYQRKGAIQPTRKNEKQLSWEDEELFSLWGEEREKGDKRWQSLKVVYLEGFEEVDTPFSVEVSGVYSHLTAWLLENKGNEHAGYGYVSPSGDLAFVTQASSGTPGSVTITELQAAEQWLLFNEEGYEINLQVHTHPTMLPYWSATDERDQDSWMREQGLPGRPDGGEFTFLVYNATGYVARRFWWNNKGDVTYSNNGDVTLHGVSLNNVTTNINLESSSLYKLEGFKEGKEPILYVETFDALKAAMTLHSVLNGDKKAAFFVSRILYKIQADKFLTILSELLDLGFTATVQTLLELYPGKNAYQWNVDNKEKTIERFDT